MRERLQIVFFKNCFIQFVFTRTPCTLPLDPPLYKDLTHTKYKIISTIKTLSGRGKLNPLAIHIMSKHDQCVELSTPVKQI